MPTSRLVSKSHFFRDLDLSSILVPDEEPPLFYGTKIICTLGPSCHDVESLAALVNAGMSVARIDLTWGPLEFHLKSLLNLQTALKRERKMCAIMIDILGREIMIRRQFKLDETGWPIHESPLHIEAGSTVTVTTRPEAEATGSLLPVTYENFNLMVQPGDTLYIGRYLVTGADRASLYLEVQEVQGTEIVCIAKNEAELDGLMTVFHSERSNDELNNLQNNLPFLSDYDKECLKSLATQFDIDFLSTSYTRTADDIRDAKRFLTSIGLTDTRIVSKLETRQALLNLQSIVSESDGIMLSRGNLGLDVAPEKMAQVQKTVVTACNVIGKPVILTRVVDTMVNTPRPTRAEATDIANAVLDGVDGFLLGAETLRGKYPVETVNTINKICRSAEMVFDHNAHHDHLAEVSQAAEEALALINLTDEDSDSSPDMQNSGTITPADDATVGLSASGGSAGGVGGRSGSVVTFADAAGGASHHGSMGGLHGPSNLGLSHHRQEFDSSNSLSSLERMHGGRSGGSSYATLSHAMNGLSRGLRSSRASLATFGKQEAAAITHAGDSYMAKLESIASSAVRTAERVGASLIVVYTTSGKTAQLVAKYRPPMPILTLVVPHLVSDGIKWQLKGKAVSRQCLMIRGLLPVLAAPSPSGDALLEEAIGLAGNIGIVQPHDHVVCVQRVQRDFCVKVVSVDELAMGIQRLDPQTGARLPMERGALLRTASERPRPILGQGSGPFSPKAFRVSAEEFVSVPSTVVR